MSASPLGKAGNGFRIKPGEFVNLLDGIPFRQGIHGDGFHAPYHAPLHALLKPLFPFDLQGGLHVPFVRKHVSEPAGKGR